MTLPSRPESSLTRFAPGSRPTHAFLEFRCPSTFQHLQRLRADSACASSSCCQAYLPDFAAPSEFLAPSAPCSASAFRPCFVPVPSMGLPSLRRFLPACSPAGLSARRCPPCRHPPCGGPASRISASAGRVSLLHGVSTGNARSSPGRFSPSRYRTFRSRSALPRRSSLGLLRVPSDPVLAHMVLGSTSCSSEFQRTRRSARLSLHLPPWGLRRFAAPTLRQGFRTGSP